MLLCSLPVSARRHAVGRPLQPQRILFVGNSLTGVNDLPNVLCRLAERTGKPLACGAAILDGASLLDHLDDGGAARQIADGKYTIVAMQQGPSSLESSRIELIDSAEHFAVFIRAAGGRPAMYAVWPERARLFAFDAVADSYRLAAEAVHGVLFPVGSAWQAVWRVDPQFALYGPDGFTRASPRRISPRWSSTAFCTASCRDPLRCRRWPTSWRARRCISAIAICSSW